MDTAPTRKYDLYSQAFKARPWPTFAAMRRDDPVHRQTSLDGSTDVWFVTRYDLVEAALRDRRLVRDPRRAGYDMGDMGVFGLIDAHMLNRDGDDHRRLRTLVQQAFTPKRVAALRPRVEAIAAELLAAMKPKGEADLLAEFAFPLPTIVILEMLGVPPEDRDRFRDWSNALIAPALSADELAESQRLMEDFLGYLRDLFASRRDDPRDDLISALLQAEEAGDRLSETELFSTMVLLIVAGHETTVNLIANATLLLLRHPDALARLKTHPDEMPHAVEEFLRLEGSVERALNRWAAEDLEIGGRTIRRGEPVILILGAANRDEGVFENAEALELQRQPNPHLAFGKGIHYCLGAPLARLEGEVAMNAVLRELEGLELAVEEEELRWRFLPGFRALEGLVVRWEGE